MPILSAVAPVGSEVLRIDVIEHEGDFWLVPQWLTANDGTHQRPARMISLTTIRHQRLDSGEPADFVLNDPLPEYLLEGEVPREEAARYRILNYPEIVIPLPNRRTS